MNDIEMAIYAFVTETAGTRTMGEILDKVTMELRVVRDTVQSTFVAMVMKTKQIDEYYDDDVDGWRYKPN